MSRRLGLVVHPRREIGGALDALRGWCEAHGAELVQVAAPGQSREVAPRAAAATCEAVVALGGDGTTLAALHVAAPADRPVLGVACGSLGALSSVRAEDVDAALDRFDAGEWSPRRLPGLEIAFEGAEPLVALNDLVIVRHGAGQVSAALRVDGELFLRFAGDGLVVATPLGSSAYSLAAGGPLLAGADGLVVTPLAPHGGSCPPLVAGPQGRLEIALDPAHGGARIEVDGQVRAEIEPLSLQTFTVALRPDHATLVTLGDQEPLLTGLRRRGLIADSPRMLVRDARLTAR